MNAYEATWVAALSVLAAGQNNGQAIQKALPGVANNYFGASGWTQLQASGDEAPVGYSIYEVAPRAGRHSGSWQAPTLQHRTQSPGTRQP